VHFPVQHNVSSPKRAGNKGSGTQYTGRVLQVQRSHNITGTALTKEGRLGMRNRDDVTMHSLTGWAMKVFSSNSDKSHLKMRKLLMSLTNIVSPSERRLSLKDYPTRVTYFTRSQASPNARSFVKPTFEEMPPSFSSLILIYLHIHTITTQINCGQ